MLPRPRGPLTVLLLRLLVLALLYSAQRLCFFLFNPGSFPDAPFLAFVGGVRFDLSAIAWLNLPWVVLYLIAPARRRAWATVQKVVFLVVNGIGFAFNCADIEYFKFTLKRSTADLLSILTTGSDTANLMPAFLRDYWYIALIFLVCLLLAGWGYTWSGRFLRDRALPWSWKFGWRIVTVALFALLSRGGLQLIPLQVLEAGKYAPPAYFPLVLNTPYTLLMSLGKPVLEPRIYMSVADAELRWPVVHQYADGANTPFDLVTAARRPNVVVIILESFSGVYSSKLTGLPGYMPFLDSLMSEGMYCTRAYANGRRSIDGIPAVLASIPELMDEAFITSPYADVPFTSLANELKKDGYGSSFFHGGNNGTMGFDGFARSAGFDRYVGRDQYPDPNDYDGSWGIRDRPFFQFFARELGKQQEPFVSAIFSLSSHHPYELLSEDAERFKGGTLKIHPTLRYADDALRHFFKTASTMPWFDHTLFVITADHTADIDRSGQHYGKAIDYWVPLVYYMPKYMKPGRIDRVTEQIDVLPTVLDLIGHRDPFFAFGHSALRATSPPYAISSSNGVYRMIGEEHLLRFDGKEVVGFGPIANGDPDDGPAELIQADMVLRMQAAVQQFNGHLLLRNMKVTPP
ncbi:MAG: LTA synthase family protein [Flavobacteriales bacterium]|nr:LTA synthase family protein [Flavobacteriales bacterium]MCB9166507.1 LTA synthase family protein [Flavobacteriales bacterium]